MTKDMIVTDVGSTKRLVCELAAKILPFPRAICGEPSDGWWDGEGACCCG